MNKGLGQHFLRNKVVINKIISAISLERDGVVIEIGPGKGALTFPLVKVCEKIGCRIVAIEKDPRLSYDISHIANSKNLEIITGDALKIIPQLITDKLIAISYKLVGNIPYYITGKLLRLLQELEHKPKIIVLMIQKEVAERMTAKSPKMNLLAASIQIWADTKIIDRLKNKDFVPPPKVESAIIKITPSKNDERVDLTKYYQLIKIIFKQPRKTLLNNLKAGLKLGSEEIMGILTILGLTEKTRPQNLTTDILVKLVNRF